MKKGWHMNKLMLLVTLALCGCDRGERESAQVSAPAAPQNVTVAPVAQSKAPLVTPLPKDQAQLDRLILAGYEPHMDHLHPPGVKSCPLIQGTDAVM